MKKCPKCMAKTEGNFCPECGYDMSLVDTYVCPVCGRESSSLFCPDCGTKLQNTMGNAAGIADNTIETVAAENSSESPDSIETNDTSEQVKPIISKAEIKKDVEFTASGMKDIGSALIKRPVILGIVATLVMIVLIASLSTSGKSSKNGNNNTDSYTTSEQVSDYDSDSTYSDSSTTYSETDDGLDPIQGTWYMKGVVNDGELTDVSAYSVGKLIITGDQWDMTISTGETTNTNGTVYLDFKQKLDDGSDYYVYTMKGSGYSGSVKMTYSAADNFIAVSTGPQLDSDNCMFFGK